MERAARGGAAKPGNESVGAQITHLLLGRERPSAAGRHSLRAGIAIETGGAATVGFSDRGQLLLTHDGCLTGAIITGLLPSHAEKKAS